MVRPRRTYFCTKLVAIKIVLSSWLIIKLYCWQIENDQYLQFNSSERKKYILKYFRHNHNSNEDIKWNFNSNLKLHFSLIYDLRAWNRDVGFSIDEMVLVFRFCGFYWRIEESCPTKNAINCNNIFLSTKYLLPRKPQKLRLPDRKLIALLRSVIDR
jgi:hypothetical protein